MESYEYVTIRGQEFHLTAQQIVGGLACTGEAGYRTACGRAYYAVYLSYREAIRRQVGDAEYDFQHRSLRKALDNPRLHWKVAKLGKYVASLFRWRTESDYYPSTHTVRLTDATDRTQDARAAVVLIDELVGTSVPLPVPTKHERDI